MKNLLETIKKYQTYILTFLFVIFLFRSCSKSSNVKKLEKTNANNTHVIDSLNSVILNQNESINNISEVVRVEKIKVHMQYDNYISSKDRGEQLMELHMIVKKNIKDLEK